MSTILQHVDTVHPVMDVAASVIVSFIPIIIRASTRVDVPLRIAPAAVGTGVSLPHCAAALLAFPPLVNISLPNNYLLKSTYYYII